MNTNVLTAERPLTEFDHFRLSRLLDRERASTIGALPQALRALLDLLDTCDVVPAAAIDRRIVTMRSRVLLQHHASDTRRVVTLGYPEDAPPGEGEKISVLSPMGVTLLGARTGQVATWRGPQGEHHQATVCEVMFQPEAQGDFRL